MNRKALLTILACLVILAAGAGLTMLIFATEPEAQREGATKKSAMLVDVTRAERGSYRPVIEALGTVEPARDVMLGPRVEGEIVAVSERFVPGGLVEPGEVLLEIDPADYRSSLQQRRSELRTALADLAMEQGRAELAREEYELLGRELPEENEQLVLRVPQIESTRARVESARAAVAQAELHLERTKVRAPFRAQVLTREVNLGSQVEPGQTLARLVGVEEYWVAATLPLAQLAWLELAEGGEAEGSEALVRQRSAWPEGVHRRGRLDRLVGVLEERTRLARVLVTVPDPLALEEENAGQPRLLVGSYVETRLRGRELPDVLRLDRALVRKDDTAWVMADDGTLAIRKLDIRLRDAEHAYVTAGLEEDDRVVTTNLATVSEGAPLRLEGGGDGDETGSRGAKSPPEDESAADGGAMAADGGEAAAQ